jgi:hypothetical protein
MDHRGFNEMAPAPPVQKTPLAPSPPQLAGADAIQKTNPYAGYLVLTIMGSVFIGAVLPSMLVCMRIWYIGHHDIAEVMLLAILGCGPGAMALSFVLFFVFMANSPRWTLKRARVMGAFWGAAASFTNIPGYLVISLMERDSSPILRTFLLFLVTGATCGSWVAANAWLVHRPRDPFWPRFSLRTLMILMLAWGTLMAVFRPARPEPLPRIQQKYPQ